MTTRKTPSTFRQRAEDGADTPAPGPAGMASLTDDAAQIHALAVAIASARQRAELLALAEAHGEAIVPTMPAGLDLAACDDLLDPTGAVTQRQAYLRQLLAAVAPHASPDDGLLQLIHDETQFQRCWAATLGWGPAIQDLLADTAIHTITIMGTTVLGVGPQGRVVRQHAYASPQEPRRFAEFLVQACGRTWNRAKPALRLTFAHGTCIHLYRAPLVGTGTDMSAGLLIVIQRGRRQPTTLGDLVAQGMLDRPAAELLAVVMHANCNVLVSGPAGLDTTSVLEALVNTRPPETMLVFVESDSPTLALTTPDLVTRLPRDPAQPQAPPWGTLPFTPDRLVLHALRADEAGAMLQQAEAGLSVVASIEAATIHAVLRRLARQAALPHSSFAGDPAHALRVISDTFHLVVHVGFDPHLRCSVVQEIALLAGFAEGAQVPICLPLVTTTRTEESITWTCRARVEDAHVVWNSAVGAPPERFVQRLASIPPQRWQQMLPDLLIPPQVASPAGTFQQPASALDRARAALQAAAWEEAAAALNEAAQSDNDPAVRALLDEAYQIPAFVAPLDATLDAATQRLRAALAAWDLDQAQRISAADASSRLVGRLPTHDPPGLADGARPAAPGPGRHHRLPDGADPGE